MDGKIAAQPRKRDEISLYISRISYENGLVFDISAQGVDNSLLASYADLIGKNIINRGKCTMRFIADNGNIHTACPPDIPVKKCKKINGAAFRLHRWVFFLLENFPLAQELLHVTHARVP